MRQVVLPVALTLIGLVLASPTPADIPLPKADSDTDRFAEAIELGPIEPLPPIARVASDAGAGRLPEGVTVTTEVSRLEPVQRQTFLVTQTILDPARQLREVEVHRPEGEGIDARPLAVTRDTIEIDGRLVDRRHYRWAVQALRGGEQRLRFSRIDFEVVGLAQSEYAFVPVARRLTVADLPPHLPTYLPVTPGLAIEPAHVSALVAGEPGSWRFRVRGEGLSAEGLSRLIEAQLVAPPGLRLGAPAVHALGQSAEPSPRPTESISPLASDWQVDISLLPTTEGDSNGQREARLPALRLPYIDPRADEPGAELDYARLAAEPVSWEAPVAKRRLAALWAALPVVIGGLVGLAGLVTLGRWGWRRWQARRDRRMACRRLLAAGDVPTLRRELLAVLDGLPRPLRPATRQGLARRGVDQGFLEAWERLETWCFNPQQGPASADFAAVRQQLAERLPARWFR